MFAAARLALSEIFSPPFRVVLWKSLGLTIALLVALWFALQAFFYWAIEIESYPWIETVVGILGGLGLLVGLAFLIAPVTAIFAGLFTDEIAAIVERTDYPADPPGRDAPITESLVDGLRFAGVVLLVNLVAFALLLVPVLNLIAFFVGNGYLLGREYFEAAARRFLTREEAQALRRANGATVFIGGVLIAVFLTIPILNLLTPLFATAFMVHLYKRIGGGPGLVSQKSEG